MNKTETTTKEFFSHTAVFLKFPALLWFVNTIGENPHFIS